MKTLNYEVNEEIGRGDYGVVYHGQYNGQHVAVKRSMKRDKIFVEGDDSEDEGYYTDDEVQYDVDAKKEYELLRAVQHIPAFPRVYELIITDEYADIIMEYICPAEHNDLSQEDYGAQLYEAVREMIKAGVIHYDLQKTSNIIVDHQQRVRIIDLGGGTFLSKLNQRSLRTFIKIEFSNVIGAIIEKYGDSPELNQLQEDTMSELDYEKLDRYFGYEE